MILVAQMVKNLPAMQETWVWYLGQEDSPGEGNGYPPQYSCLDNPMDRGPWRATVHGVAKSWTEQLILSLTYKNGNLTTFYNTWLRMRAQPLSHVQLFVTPWTVAHQGPLFTDFPRQECWSGLPFPSCPRDQTCLLNWQLESFPLSNLGSPWLLYTIY